MVTESRNGEIPTKKRVSVRTAVTNMVTDPNETGVTKSPQNSNAGVHADNTGHS